MFQSEVQLSMSQAVISGEMQVCEVCRRLDKDDTLKMCLYCKFCGVWICLSDIVDYVRRVKAALGGK